MPRSRRHRLAEQQQVPVLDGRIGGLASGRTVTENPVPAVGAAAVVRDELTPVLDTRLRFLLGDVRDLRLLPVLAAAAAITPAQPACACDCLPLTAAEARAEASVIFVGTVTARR